MIRIILTTILLLAISTGFAQSDRDQRTESAVVSLNKLVRDALARNPEVAFFTAEIAAAKGERRTAGMRPNPEFSAQLGVKSVESDGHSNEGVASSFSLQQLFEGRNRIELRKAIANRQIELAELGLA